MNLEPGMANTSASKLSLNGHETNRQLASRNLEIQVDRLCEMRWMIEKAGGDIAAFDRGVDQLRSVFGSLQGK